MKPRTGMAVGTPLALLVAVILLATGALAGGDARTFTAALEGFQEVPAISTMGSGEFRARVDPGDTMIRFFLGYSGLESDAFAAHIHLGQTGVNGGVIAFLCGGGDKPACPLRTGTVTGTIDADDVIGPSGQGISAAELAEALRAMRAGVTYVNVHTSTFPGGEIRGQVSG